MRDTKSAEIMGAVARAWCYKENEHKEMDSDLAIAASKEVEQLFDKKLKEIAELQDERKVKKPIIIDWRVAEKISKKMDENKNSSYIITGNLYEFC